MRFDRDAFKDMDRKQASLDQTFNTESSATHVPEHRLGHEFDIEKHQSLVASLKEKELVEKTEDIYEEREDGTSSYEWTQNHHFSPADFFAGIPSEVLQDSNFWAALLSDGQIEAKFYELHGAEGFQYIAFMPESVRRNPKFSHLIIKTFKLETLFSHMKRFPEEFTPEQRQEWTKNFPDLAFFYAQYLKDKSLE